MGNSEKGILVALGENWAKGQHGTRRDLSRDSINTTKAAEVLLQAGNFTTLIFSTGYTNGRQQIAEADAMNTLLHSLNPNIEEKIKIFRETTSYDTPTNLAEIKKLIATYQLEGPITLVAPQYHLPRTRRIAHAFGMEITTIPAEKVLDIQPRKTPLTEYPLRFLAMFDPEGRIPRIITKRRLR